MAVGREPSEAVKRRSPVRSAFATLLTSADRAIMGLAVRCSTAGGAETRRRTMVAPDVQKRMTVLQATFIGVGSMVGAGIFALLGAAGAVAGSAVWVSFLIAGGDRRSAGLFVRQARRQVPHRWRPAGVSVPRLRAGAYRRDRRMAVLHRRIHRGRDDRRLVRRVRQFGRRWWRRVLGEGARCGARGRDDRFERRRLHCRGARAVCARHDRAVHPDRLRGRHDRQSGIRRCWPPAATPAFARSSPASRSHSSRSWASVSSRSPPRTFRTRPVSFRGRSTWRLPLPRPCTSPSRSESSGP